jgi:hypothetical protein
MLLILYPEVGICNNLNSPPFSIKCHTQLQTQDLLEGTLKAHPSYLSTSKKEAETDGSTQH